MIYLIISGRNKIQHPSVYQTFSLLFEEIVKTRREENIICVHEGSDQEFYNHLIQRFNSEIAIFSRSPEEIGNLSNNDIVVRFFLPGLDEGNLMVTNDSFNLGRESVNSRWFLYHPLNNYIYSSHPILCLTNRKQNLVSDTNYFFHRIDYFSDQSIYTYLHPSRIMVETYSYFDKKNIVVSLEKFWFYNQIYFRPPDSQPFSHIELDGTGTPRVTTEFLKWREKGLTSKEQNLPLVKNSAFFFLIYKYGNGEIKQKIIPSKISRETFFLDIYQRSIKENPVFIHLKKIWKSGISLCFVDPNLPSKEDIFSLYFKYGLDLNILSQDGDLIVNSERLRKLISDNSQNFNPIYCLALLLLLSGDD